MIVRDLLIKLDKPEHLNKELIVASDEEGNRYFGDINIDEKHKYIMIISGSGDVELEDYL